MEKMSNITLQTPVRSSHRIIHKIISSSFPGIDEPSPEVCDKISEVFKKMKGSWESVFKGSAKDISLIKKILRVALKKKLLKKKK
jgi:hypothetical protein